MRVLEDTDGDGRYDKSTLFADGLNFPTGLLTWRDGVIVTAAPDVVYLRDTDGDGKADAREVLVTGLTTGNQQLLGERTTLGPGWLGLLRRGWSPRQIRRRNETANQVGRGACRVRAISGSDPIPANWNRKAGRRNLGRNRDDWGHWFGTQNSRPLWHYVLPDHYLRRNPYVAAPEPRQQVVVPLNPKVWPLSPQEKRYHSFNEGGHFTSACSGMILSRRPALRPGTRDARVHLRALP